MKKDYQPILDYVEGRISAEDFHKELYQNLCLKHLLSKWKCEMTTLKDYNFNFYNFLIKDWRFNSLNWNKVKIRFYLKWWLEVFLKDKGIIFTPLKQYEEDYNLLIDIQPSWLDIDDDTIFQQIIENIPQGLSNTQRIKVGREKVKAMFKYDKTYPRWLQDPEWPIENGRPLVFSHQKKVKSDDCHMYYYFYNEDTKEQKVVEQFG